MNRLLFMSAAVLVGATVTQMFPQGQQPQAPDLNAYYQIGPDALSHEGVPNPTNAHPAARRTHTGVISSAWRTVDRGRQEARRS